MPYTKRLTAIRERLPRRAPVYRDPTMLYPGVVAYRLMFNLTPNEGFRREIEMTIGPEGPEGVRLWNDILRNWKGNPKNIKGMMDRYEYLLEIENELRHR